MANIVEAVKNELMGDLLEKLAASVGGSVDSVKSAANVATPSLLSALAGLALSPQGIDKLLAALRGFEADSPGSLRTDIVEGRGDAIHHRGADLLGSLLGDGLASFVKSLAQFVNADADMIKRLLGYLTPLILSFVAGQLKSKGGFNAGSLASFFTEQKSNIGGAIPPGLSLAGLPTPPRHPAPGEIAPQSGPASPRYWMISLLVLGVVALVIWYLFLQQPTPPPNEADETATTTVPRHPQPVAPAKTDANAKPKASAEPESNEPPPAESEERPAEAVRPPTAGEVTRSLGDVHVIAIQSIASINNAETAEGQLPVLTALGPKLDDIKANWDKLSNDDKAKVTNSTSENRDAFKSLVEKTLKAPEIAEKLGGVLNTLVDKMDAFAA